MFYPDQKVIIDTAIGGTEHANYKQPLAALKGAHEVWVGNRPSASRIVWTRNIEDVPVTEARA